jgi:nucleotide-binding universal stress UspA family protein
VRDDAPVSRILVGYDGSDGARRALDRAVSEARDSHGRITVVSVASMPLDLDSPRNFGTLDDISPDESGSVAAPPEVVAHLEEARDILAAGGIDPDLTWAAGDPGHEIVETAKRIGARTIVLGEHHHGFLAKVFGGDVGAGVQREAGCTVILA